MENITVNNISKAYGDVKVLKNFSAMFAYGKNTVIMGKSGCGKTTLLRIMMGIDKDYTGTVDGMPELFSVVFQDDRLCEEFSVIDNVRMVINDVHHGHAENADKTGNDMGISKEIGKKPEISDIDLHIMKILTELGLADNAASKVSELSGGQKRRVAIARALAYDSELLIMDEPFNGLDEETKKMVAAAILKRKKTVIMVTHAPDGAVIMGADVIKID